MNITYEKLRSAWQEVIEANPKGYTSSDYIEMTCKELGCTEQGFMAVLYNHQDTTYPVTDEDCKNWAGDSK